MTKPTDPQKAALAELKALATTNAGIRHVGERPLTESGELLIDITLDTSSIKPVEGGLPVGDEEQFLIVVGRQYPWVPPTPGAEHWRFSEFAHVISGHQLCVFLNPDQEWHRELGMAGFLEALWNFLVEGAAGKFDENTALFHAVGGAISITPGTPLVVVRNLQVPATRALFRLEIASPNALRSDVRDWTGAGTPAVGVVPRKRLTYGAGDTVGELFMLLSHPDGRGLSLPAQPKAEALRHRLAVAAARTERGTPVYMVIAAPNPSVPHTHHLLCGRLPAAAADRLRTAVVVRGAAAIQPGDLPAATPIEWCAVSDERPSFITRRDARRQVRHLEGCSVELWGCGGLGSWIGEFLVRAGVRRIVLRDVARVAGGLLVRQNYLDEDIGVPKALALARRLDAIADGTEVIPTPDTIYDLVGCGELPDCDLIVDATINNGVNEVLSQIWNNQANRPIVVRVATDIGSATLGHVLIANMDSKLPPAGIDEAAGADVLADAELERYHTFWKPDRRNELVPAPGCSLPTYHGSSADLAAVAGTMTNLIAGHMKATSSGVHLFATPTASGTGPAHRFVEVEGKAA